jgi:SAM-dependent methyltransferase
MNATTNATSAGAPVTAAEPTVWELGDYDRVARDLIAPFGPELVEACAIGAGARVLDVGAGSGNVAIAAAAAGAEVVASDPSAGLLEIGQERARRRGLALDWVQADAQALPFEDGSFDVVTSAVGAMFAPDHEAAARELVRVCRPGGRIGLINWPPGGWAAEFFALFAEYAPPSAEDQPAPVLWGSERYLRNLLGSEVTRLEATPCTLVVDHFNDPQALCDYYRQHFGPVIATYERLADAPERRARLDREFAAFASNTNTSGPNEPAVYHLSYTRFVAHRR